MKRRMIEGAAVVAMVWCAGCAGGGEDGPKERFNVSVEDPSATCPAGGVTLSQGTDDDGNGTLDPGERRWMGVVCNRPGRRPADLVHDFLILNPPTPPPEASCPADGRYLVWGSDLNGNLTLDPPEVDGGGLLCRLDGPAGDGVELTLVQPLPPGAACPGGGAITRQGVDGDGDHRLQPGEMRATTFACDLP